MTGLVIDAEDSELEFSRLSGKTSSVTYAVSGGAALCDFGFSSIPVFCFLSSKIAQNFCFTLTTHYYGSLSSGETFERKVNTGNAHEREKSVLQPFKRLLFIFIFFLLEIWAWQVSLRTDSLFNFWNWFGFKMIFCLFKNWIWTLLKYNVSNIS